MGNCRRVAHLSTLIANFAEEFGGGFKEARLGGVRLQRDTLYHRCQQVVPTHGGTGMEENVVMVGVPESLDAVGDVNAYREQPTSTWGRQEEWTGFGELLTWPPCCLLPARLLAVLGLQGAPHTLAATACACVI